MKPAQTENVRVYNDGLHSARTLNTIHYLFNTHDLKDATLYQFILSGSQDREVYQATIKSLIRHIRTKCRAEYIGAYEVGEEKSGLHTHVFVIVETVKHFPSDLLSVASGQFIDRLRKRKDISIRIEPPKNTMHGGALFARMDTPEKLENCINWTGYIVKPRSKDNVPGRETYFGSEFISNIGKREAQRQKHRDALHKSRKLDMVEAEPIVAVFVVQNNKSNSIPAIKTDRIDYKAPQSDSNNYLIPNPTQAIKTPPRPSNQVLAISHNKEKDVMLSSAQNYLCSLYEHCIDQDMDVEAIRLFLIESGVPKSITQIKHDLDVVFLFTSYFDSHPAPAKQSVEEYDRIVSRSGIQSRHRVLANSNRSENTLISTF